MDIKTTHPNATQDISADYFHQKDEWFLSTLGALTAQWELAEFQLTLFLCAITGIKGQIDLLTILNAIGPAGKVRMLQSMIKFHINQDDHKAEALAILKKYDKLRARRNKYIHAMWTTDPGEQSSSPQSFMAVSRLKTYPASRKHLRLLCEDIQDLINEFGQFYDDIGHVLIIDALPG